MEIILNKFVKVSSNYHIRIGEAFLKVNGSKINLKDFDDFEFFLHKVKIGDSELFQITEALSGVALSKPDLKLIKLKNKIEDNIQSIGKEKFKAKILNKIADLYLSPSFKTIVNPNRIIHVAIKKNKNKRFDDASEYRVCIQKK